MDLAKDPGWLPADAMGQEPAGVVRDGLDVLADPHPTGTIPDDPAAEHRVA